MELNSDLASLSVQWLKPSFSGMILRPWEERKRPQKEILGSLQGPLSGVANAQVFSFGPPSLPSAVTYRLSTCRAVGGFGGSLSTSAFDADYVLRVAMQFDIGFANEVLSDYTLHPHQISEEFWRRSRTTGMVDTAIEMLNAGCWLLGRESIADDTRREVAHILSQATTLMARCVKPRAQAVGTF